MRHGRIAINIPLLIRVGEESLTLKWYHSRLENGTENPADWLTYQHATKSTIQPSIRSHNPESKVGLHRSWISVQYCISQFPWWIRWRDTPTSVILSTISLWSITQIRRLLNQAPILLQHRFTWFLIGSWSVSEEIREEHLKITYCSCRTQWNEGVRLILEIVACHADWLERHQIELPQQIFPVPAIERKKLQLGPTGSIWRISRILSLSWWSKCGEAWHGTAWHDQNLILILHSRNIFFESYHITARDHRDLFWFCKTSSRRWSRTSFMPKWSLPGAPTMIQCLFVSDDCSWHVPNWSLYTLILRTGYVSWKDDKEDEIEKKVICND